MEVNLPEEQVKKIEKIIRESNFKSIDDFLSQAANLLIYAEERKKDFENIISGFRNQKKEEEDKK